MVYTVQWSIRSWISKFNPLNTQNKQGRRFFLFYKLSLGLIWNIILSFLLHAHYAVIEWKQFIMCSIMPSILCGINQWKHSRKRSNTKNNIPFHFLSQLWCRKSHPICLLKNTLTIHSFINVNIIILSWQQQNQDIYPYHMIDMVFWR